MSKNTDSIWGDFVLNEGIMPAAIVRRLKSGQLPETNIGLIAKILKDRESFISFDDKNSDIQPITKSAFSSDIELVTWLKSMDSTLNLIIDVSSNPYPPKGSDDILKSAMMYFINSCPLVSDNVKTMYLSAQCQRVSTNYIKSDKIQDAFFSYVHEYLLKKETTAYAYRSAINKISKIVNIDLWNNHELKKIENIIQLFNSTNTDTVTQSLKNANHHNNLSCALKIYKRFLCSQENIN